jgi:hypothetical protein
MNNPQASRWLAHLRASCKVRLDQACEIRSVFCKERKVDSSGLRPFGMTRFMGDYVGLTLLSADVGVDFDLFINIFASHPRDQNLDIGLHRR